MPRKDYKKPLPRLDEENRWFWEACARHELYLQRCTACGTVRYYPRALCPKCLSSQTTYLRSSGRGTVYSFTVTHQNQAAGFRDELPYVMAYVQLDEGPRVLSNVIKVPVEQMNIGLRVEVVFEDIDEGMAIPKFQRAS